MDSRIRCCGEKKLRLGSVRLIFVVYAVEQVRFPLLCLRIGYLLIKFLVE